MHEVDIGRDGGLHARIMSWGAGLRSLDLPRPDGRRQEVMLGFADPADYVRHGAHHVGTIAGRVANRIRDACFTLDGRICELSRNERGRHTLHGGESGFGRRHWTLLDHGGEYAVLGLESPEGDQGFPGAVRARCTYTLPADRVLRIELSADCDAPTPLNLAPHGYFKLDESSAIDAHLLQIHAHTCLPVDADLLPTGAVEPVAGTCRDFLQPRPLGVKDFDLAYVLDAAASGGDGVRLAARLVSPGNGLSVEVWTTAPALQLYTGHGLDATGLGHRAGLCLEPQGYPDAPNLPQFPSVVLRPGQSWRQLTEYRFHRD